MPVGMGMLMLMLMLMLIDVMFMLGMFMLEMLMMHMRGTRLAASLKPPFSLSLLLFKPLSSICSVVLATVE